VTTLALQLVGTGGLFRGRIALPQASGESIQASALAPIALLAYDTAGNFTAQFMKRDRSTDAIVATGRASVNNSAAVNGYDAYFGTYTVDEASGSVTQHLEGALSPSDVGKIVSREMRVEEDRLIIQLATTSADGETVTRTLIWLRSA